MRTLENSQLLRTHLLGTSVNRGTWKGWGPIPGTLILLGRFTTG
jgi:hypothetical protein